MFHYVSLPLVAEEAIQKLPLEDMERHCGHLPVTWIPLDTPKLLILKGESNGLGYTGYTQFQENQETHIIQTACFFDVARELVLEQIHHFRKKVLLSVAWLQSDHRRKGSFLY